MGALHKKIIYNHLLAVALAGIISLLFVHKICQFLNTSSKRSDYVSAITLSGENQESYYWDEDCHSKSACEGFMIIQNILGFRCQPHRFSKPVAIFTPPQYIFFEKNERSKTFYRSGLPPMWGPSIPIAHRRLII